MKKYYLFVFLAFIFVGCSSDGNREIQIDEVKFVPQYESDPIEKYSKVSSIFEVVPGTYQLSWALVQKVPQHKNYNVSLNLKLRLKRSVHFKKETLQDPKSLEKVAFLFHFLLLDADGNKDIDVSYFNAGNTGCTNTVSMKDSDQIMDFINFLQSKPGTEKEFVFNTLGYTTSVEGVDCIETCNNAKNIICELFWDDNHFENCWGSIE